MLQLRRDSVFRSAIFNVAHERDRARKRSKNVWANGRRYSRRRFCHPETSAVSCRRPDTSVARSHSFGSHTSKVSQQTPTSASSSGSTFFNFYDFYFIQQTSLLLTLFLLSNNQRLMSHIFEWQNGQKVHFKQSWSTSRITFVSTSLSYSQFSQISALLSLIRSSYVLLNAKWYCTWQPKNVWRYCISHCLNLNSCDASARATILFLEYFNDFSFTNYIFTIKSRTLIFLINNLLAVLLI